MPRKAAIWSELRRGVGGGRLASLDAGCALSHHASCHRLQSRGSHHRRSSGQGSSTAVLSVLRLVARGGHQLHHRAPLATPSSWAGTAAKLKPALLTDTRSAARQRRDDIQLDTIRGLTVSTGGVAARCRALRLFVSLGPALRPRRTCQHRASTSLSAPGRRPDRRQSGCLPWPRVRCPLRWVCPLHGGTRCNLNGEVWPKHRRRCP